MKFIHKIHHPFQLVAFILSLILAAFGQISWWIPVLIFAYSVDSGTDNNA